VAEPLVLCELVSVELTLAEDDEVCESDVEDDFVCEMETVALPVVLADVDFVEVDDALAEAVALADRVILTDADMVVERRSVVLVEALFV
jgi:hypothetical protein